MWLGAWVTVVILSIITTKTLANGPGGKPVGTDFVSFGSVGRLIWAGDVTGAYDPATLHSAECDLLGTECPFFAWFYPPPALFTVAAVAWLPYLGAFALWLVATAALYLSAVSRYLSGRRAQIAALAAPAVWVNVGHGQNALLSAGIMGWGLALLPSNPIAAGVVLGIMVYKPQLAVMLPVAFLAARAWRAIAATALSALSICALSLVVFGSQAWEGFLASNPLARTTLQDGLVGWEKMISAFAAARLLGAPAPLAWVIQAVVFVVCAVLVWRVWRNAASRHLPRTAVLIVAGLMATPFALDYDAVLLTVALAALAADGLQRGFGPWEVTLLALAWLAPVAWRPLALATHLPWAQATLVAVLWIAVRRCREPAPSLGP